jgi:hypothetical protein
VLSRRDGTVVLGDGDGFTVSLLHLPGEGQAVRPALLSTGYLRTAEGVTVVSPEAPSVLTVITVNSSTGD